MVEILPLEYPDNVTLLPGATQHWPDLTEGPVQTTSVLREIIDPQIPDGASVLVVGAHEVDWLITLASRAAVTVVTRGIADAATIGRALPKVSVYCGDPVRLPDEVTGFDAVIAATDLARVLPLESDIRPWRAVYDDVAARLRPGGTLVVGIENDLGLHRLNSPANPRSRNWNQDWAPLATWDATRPRTTDQVAALADAAVWTVYPQWQRVTVAHTGELSATEKISRDAAVLDAAVWPLFGPDPVWYLQSSAAADRTGDFAAGWLLISGDAQPAQVLRAASTAECVDVPAAPSDDYRGLLGSLADAMSAEDLVEIRRLVRAWAEWVRETNAPAALGTALVSFEGECASIAVRAEVGPTPWQALAELVSIAWGRGWRVPWPSPTTPSEMVSLLGAMAKLGELPADQLAALHIEAPADPEAVRRMDRQELAALIARNNERIAALDSRARWTELQYVSNKAAKKARAVGGRGMRFAKRGAKKALRVAGLYKGPAAQPVEPTDAPRP